MTDRTRVEADEWALAAAVDDHVLPQACTALALAGAKANHERAEGIR